MDINKKVHTIWIDLHKELKHFIFSKVKDAQISDDILQDVFVKIYLNVSALKDHSKLTSWIYQITRHAISDYFRHKKHYESIENLDLPEHEEPLYEALSNCINSKINNLPDKYKEIMLLTTLKTYTQIELADYLGISYSGTKSRVQRAKEKLKTLVADCENVETDSLGKIIDYVPMVK